AHDADAGAKLTYSLNANSPVTEVVNEYGTMTLSAEGGYTFTLNNGANAVQSLADGQTQTTSFEIYVTDGHGTPVATTVNVTITGTNDAPTFSMANAVDVQGSAEASGSLAGLVHDVDASDTHTFSLDNGAGSYGSLTLHDDGSYSYTPGADVATLPEGETATDSFTITVSDGHGGTADATLSFNVHGTYVAPLPEVTDPPADALLPPTDTTVPENNAENSVENHAPDAVDTSVTVTGHDVSGLFTATDADGDALTFSFEGGGAYGSLSFDDAGNYTYTLNADADTKGTDAFTVTVNDGHGNTDTATLTFNVDYDIIETNDAIPGVEDPKAPADELVKIADADVDLTQKLGETTEIVLTNPEPADNGNESSSAGTHVDTAVDVHVDMDVITGESTPAEEAAKNGMIGETGSF
ncbi:MAG: VCBS domain-containing protein, partial [Bilophila sp.]